MRAVCRDAQFVFHLAAVYRSWALDPRLLYEVNVRRRIDQSPNWV
jgi:hypothetical protein